MKILLVEPFFTGSHQRWATEYQQYSTHSIQLLTMKGKYWKWRMHGGAVTLAEQFKQLPRKPDLILATDMLDVATFKGLCGNTLSDIPIAVYFHENQLTYPWSPSDKDIDLKRDNHYAFTNYTTALAADALYFNSPYHKASFLGALPRFLGQFPDYKELHQIEKIKQKSHILPLGMDLKRFDGFQTKKENPVPVLLWNHRWEYDKNPTSFFKTLFRLSEEDIHFKLNVVGASFSKQPPIFEEAKRRLENHILHFGYLDSFQAYAECLWTSDILAVTSQQDFFGGSVVEAIYCGVYPLLPKRLAYPMHIPKQFEANHFYENDTDLYHKLKMLLKQGITRNETLSQFVQKYDWSRLVPHYDSVFEQLL